MIKREEAEVKVIHPVRIGSFLLFLLGIMFLALSAVVIFNYLHTSWRLKRIEEKKVETLRQIEELKDLYENLLDQDYYSIYVQEYYYQNGEIIYK